MAEQAFATNYLNTLSQQPVYFPDDYQQPAENSVRKVHVLPVDLPNPPERTVQASTSAALTLHFKSLKPPQAFTLSVSPTDTIADIKSQLASQPNAPPTDSQRLLLKGKLLADAKLLKEYSPKDNDTITIMIKQGAAAAAIDTQTPAPPPSATLPIHAPSPIKASGLKVSTDAPALPASVSLTLPTADETGKRNRSHQRIPSVVLSPSPSAHSPSLEKPVDIQLILDPTPALVPDQTTYQAVIVEPKYWERIWTFLKSEFPNEVDAAQAFEDYLRASKGELTASEIAKIRDATGLIGMAGT